ncbi:MarR family transcriptional regulator [Geobacter sp. FeAm09]|uniref:MarR family winged helix-turn-helix transcriptional regulator n=1 Tax=Geobacter sp. FeAm09 TaxID=2597769 RepID=UPI0011ED22E9|nr:MarR family transcriptional regulator [Geobacter sp. FeAm09]QEM67728.1 MarR family transcriptional regulator [Geobacter sp. FeAm09]
MDNTYKQINSSNLFFRLGLLTRHWRQVLDTTFQSAGLTDATWRPLLHLHLLGDGVRQKELAAAIGIEGPSLVRLLDTLMLKGLVQRSEDATDRRAKRLCLTPAGETTVARIREALATLDSELLSPFSAGDIASLDGYVATLESAVNAVRKQVRG